MATTEVGSFTVPAATGSQTITMNNSFTGSLVEFEMGPRASTTETDVRRSSGWTDGTRERAVSTYADGTVRGTIANNAYCIMHYKNTGGVFTKVASATFTSFGLGQFIINWDVVDSSYQVYYKIWA